MSKSVVFVCDACLAFFGQEHDFVYHLKTNHKRVSVKYTTVGADDAEDYVSKSETIRRLQRSVDCMELRRPRMTSEEGRKHAIEVNRKVAELAREDRQRQLEFFPMS